MHFPRNLAKAHAHFVLQRDLLRKHYPFLQCRFVGPILECVGLITPSDFCDTYRIIIRHQFRKSPRVRVTFPKIEPSSKIHIYPSGDLCLYDHRVQPWNTSFNLHETIVPWTAEWLVYYELYKIHGKWLGPEAPHGSAAKKPQDDAT